MRDKIGMNEVDERTTNIISAKRRRLLSILTGAIVVALFSLWLNKRATDTVRALDRKPNPIFSSYMRPNPTSPRPSISNKDHIDPLGDLDSMIKEFGHKADSNVDAAIALRNSKEKWESFKNAGGVLWNSKEWMKPREYYQGLKTVELARECFSRPEFFLEMGFFDDARFGLQRLEIMHDGFSELFSRDNLWEGILDCYNSAGSVIRRGTPAGEIVIRSQTLDMLSVALIYSHELRDQVRGRERTFVVAQVSALRAYSRYLEETKEDDWDKKAGLFFREPISVSEMALTLIQADDKDAFSRIEPALKAITMSRKQNREELHHYIETAIASIDNEYLNRSRI